MSKASKVSHFHSTSYSAHRGGVAHAAIGRLMAPSAPAPGTVGAMTPKFKPQAQCVPFLSPSETMRQYANRVLGGSLAALDGRMLMAGAKLGTGYQLQASETIGSLARKSVGNRNWANVTANEVFIVAFHQPMPAGMPVSTCALTERASLNWYGVNGAEEEPGTVGAMTPSIGNRVVSLGCPPGTHDDGTGFFGENCVPDLKSNGPQLQEVKETIDWIATCNKQGGIYDPDSKYYDPKDPCFQCAKGMTYDWDLHDCVGTPVTPPPPQPAAPPTPSKPQGCEPGYSLIQNPKSGESFCTQCVQEHNVLNWTTGDCTCESGFIWQDKKDPNNFKCVPKPVVEPPHPPAPKTNCGPGTHAEGEMCVANETKQVEPPAKEEDNTWKWVAGIAAAAVVVGGGTYLATRKEKKGQKGALRAKLSSHSTQTDVG